MDEWAALTGPTLAQVMDDPAYEARTVQAAVAPHTTGMAPVLTTTSQVGRFPKGWFTLNLAAETIPCPQGETAAYGTLHPRDDGGQVARWAGATCVARPLRVWCGGRTPDQEAVPRGRAR